MLCALTPAETAMLERIQKILYLLPLLLMLLTLHQLYVAFTVQKEMRSGIEARGIIEEAEIKNMISQSHGRLTLRIELPDGTTYKRHFTLPISMLVLLQDQHEIPVRVDPEDRQQVILVPLHRMQLRMALINAAIAAAGAVLALWALRKLNV